MRALGKASLVVVVTAVLGAVGSRAAAETVTVGLVDAATIDNARGEIRILFKAESLRLPQDVAISTAVLTFPKSAEGLEGVEYLAIHPVAAAWSPGSVDWTLGWNRPGGDFVEDHYARAEAVLGSAGEVTFDVTSIIKEVEEEGMYSDGFLVSVPAGKGEGMRASVAGAFDVAAGSLSVSFRRVPPRMVGR